MKKSNLLLLLLPLVIAGCSNEGDVSISGSSQDTAFVTGTVTNSSSSETNPGTSSSASTATTVKPESITIANVKDLGKDFASKVNDYGIYVSNTQVKLENIQLVAALNMISGKQSYNDGPNYNYKLIMSDDEGNIINVACDYAAYDMTSKYEAKNQRYEVTGYVGYFNNQVEVFSLGKQVRYLRSEESKDINFLAKAGDEITLKDYYEYGEGLILNDKGVAYSDKLVNVAVKCLADDVSKSHQTNATFGAGDYILHAHSDRYFTNTLEKGKNYIVTGLITVHKYRIGLEVAACTLYEETDVLFNAEGAALTTISKANSHEYSSDSKDAHPTNLDYTKFLEKPFKAKGYFGFIEGKELKSIFDDKPIAPTGSGTNTKWISVSTANQRDVLYIHGKTYAGVDLYDPEEKDKLWGHIGEEIEITFLPYECQPGKNAFMKAYPYSWKIVEANK